MPVVIDLDKPASPDGQPDKHKPKSAGRTGNPARRRSTGAPESGNQVLLGTVLAIVAVVALVFVGMQLFHGPRETGSNGPPPATPQSATPAPASPTLGPLPLTRRASPGPGRAPGMSSPAPVIPGVRSRPAPNPGMNMGSPPDGESQDGGIH